MAEKASIEFDTIVKIVIVLAVLMIVLIFFRGGFGKMGSGIGMIGSNVSSKAPDTGSSIGNVFTGVTEQWGTCTFKITAAASCTVEIAKGDCKKTVSITAGANQIQCGCKLTRKATPTTCTNAELSIAPA
jgi:hypothetical protein